MDSRDRSKTSAAKNEHNSVHKESQPEPRQEPDPKAAMAKRSQELADIRKKITQCSQVLSKGEKVSYCSMDGMDSGLPLTPDEEGALPAVDSTPNDVVMQKFGQDYHSESVIPGFYTWFQGDGSVVRYVVDFVLYTSRGDRFVPLEHLGRYEQRILMFCKVKHIGLVHTAEDLLETNHPWAKTFKNKKKVEMSEGLLKVPRKQRFFSSKIVLVDWFFDVGTSEDSMPYVWVVSDNDVYYRIERPAGGYYNAFMPAKMLFDLSTRIVKEMQSGTDKPLKDVLVSMTTPSNLYRQTKAAHYRMVNGQNSDSKEENVGGAPSERVIGDNVEDMTVWGAPVSVHGSTLVDVYRNLDFIFSECRYHYTFFGAPKLERYLSDLVDALREQSPFHYFDNKFMTMDYLAKNTLANKYKDDLYLPTMDIPNMASLIKPVKLAKMPKRGPKTKRFDLEEYNNQYNMNDVKSRSGRVIRNKAVSEIEPAVRKHVVQTESQKKEEYRKAVELEAKCDGLLLPFDFEWSNYNTCSEASDTDSSPPVLRNDVEVALDNAKYYPRDIPLRTLKFYGTDEIVDLLDLTRQFSVPSLSSQPLLPKMTFVQLEANLIFTCSLNEYRPQELSSFEVTTPLCLCNNKRFSTIYNDINASKHYHFYMYNNAETTQAEAPPVTLPDKPADPDAPPQEDDEFEDGMQWIYYLNKNLIDEGDVEYPEDLDEGSTGRLYLGLMEELRRSVEKYGFDWFVHNLRESGELSDKKKEVQERELGVAITDADLAMDFVNTNGGCLYRGRFKRIGNGPNSTLPYVNSTRWNKRFKKFQRVVTVSSNYRFTTISHEHSSDGFTVFDSSRPKNCPLDLVYGADGCFKTVSTPGDQLPTFKRVLNVWKQEAPQVKRSNNQLKDSVNTMLGYFNKFAREAGSSENPGNVKLDLSAFDEDYILDYLVDGIDDIVREPILGFGFREPETICQSEFLLAEDMLTEYTWNSLLKLYLFYALYNSRTTYRFKFNSVVWGDPAFFSNYPHQYSDQDQKASQTQDYDEDMIDTEKLKMLDDIGFDEYENSNSGAEEDQSKEDDEDEEEEADEPDEGDDGEEGEDKDRSTRRGWGINRYCPYYEFEMEWHPDDAKFQRLNKGRVSPTFVKSAFLKLRQKTFLQLDLHERLSLLLWLGDILGYSATGKTFIDDRNDEFYYLKAQLMRAEDDKKGAKRQKGTSRELFELEERYLQRPVFLGQDRFYNSYYYFGLDYERRIYVHTMPQLRFVQNRIQRRAKFLRGPTYRADQFNLDLSEFAQKFAQDRIFSQTKSKRGRKKEVVDPDSLPEVTPGKRRRKNQAALDALNGSHDPSAKVNPDPSPAANVNGVAVQGANQLAKTEFSDPKLGLNGAAFNGLNGAPNPELGLQSPQNSTHLPAEFVKRDVQTGVPGSSLKVKEEVEEGRQPHRDSQPGAMKSLHEMADNVAAKDEELVRKRRIKNRSRNRPKVRRSRQVFDRHPTFFGTVEEYLSFLANTPARLSWCVIDSHKSLKRFIARLSQFTTNERSLALKLAQVEPDFTLPAFEILTYKCPTVIGEMLLTLLRGVYRFFKNTFSKMVLSTVVLNGRRAAEDSDAQTPVSSAVNAPTVAEKVNKSYNNGLFLNLFVNDLVKTCLTLCISDLDGSKRCLKLMIELIYFFEFVTNRFYQDQKWSHMRNEWKMNLDAIYSQLIVDPMTTRRVAQPKPVPATKFPGEHASNCFVYNNNNTLSTPGSTLISTPSGTADLIQLVEKTGLWFRFFEVYSRDKADQFNIGTTLNYAKFRDLYSKQLSLQVAGGAPKQPGSDAGQGPDQLTLGEKLEVKLLDLHNIDLFEYLNHHKVTDTLVYFSGAMLELIGSVQELLKRLQDTLGIKVAVEKGKAKTSKSKGRRKKKKKDKDEESDSNLTDLESNLDPTDYYQDQPSEDPKEAKDEPSQVNSDDAPPTPKEHEATPTESKASLGNAHETAMSDKTSSEAHKPDEGSNAGGSEPNLSDPRSFDSNVSPTSADATNEHSSGAAEAGPAESNLTPEAAEQKAAEEKGEKREREEKGEKPRKKRTKNAKNAPAAEDQQPPEDEESSNELEAVQAEAQNPEPEANNEELLEPIKKLLLKLEMGYQQAPKETLQVTVLSMSTNLLKLKLPKANRDASPPPASVDQDSHAGSENPDSHDPEPAPAKEPAPQKQDADLEILCLNLTLRSHGYEQDSDGEDEDLSEDFGLVTNLRRVCRTMSRVEKTRATKKVTEEPGFTPRPNESAPPRTFTLTLPVVLRSPYNTQLPQFLFTYSKVYDGLSQLWRTPLKCKNRATNQLGIVKRASYARLDIWKCVSVEWNDNRKEQVAHNPWELTM